MPYNIYVTILDPKRPTINIYPEYGLTTDNIREAIRGSGMIPDIPDDGEETPYGCTFNAYYYGEKNPSAIHAELVKKVYGAIDRVGKKKARLGDLKVSSQWHSTQPAYSFDN